METTTFGNVLELAITLIRLFALPSALLAVALILLNKENKISLLLLFSASFLSLAGIPFVMLVAFKAISLQQFSDYSTLSSIINLIGMVSFIVAIIWMALKLKTKTESSGIVNDGASPLRDKTPPCRNYMRIAFQIFVTSASLILGLFWAGLMAYGLGMGGGSTGISSYSSFSIYAPFLYLITITIASYIELKKSAYLTISLLILGLTLFSLILPHDGGFEEKIIVSAIIIAPPAIWAFLYLIFFAHTFEQLDSTEADQDAGGNG